jgi:hypothetical protein
MGFKTKKRNYLLLQIANKLGLPSKKKNCTVDYFAVVA